MNRKFLQPVIMKSQPVITNLKTGHHYGAIMDRIKMAYISNNKWHFFLKFVCVDYRSALTLTLLQMHTSLCTESAIYNLSIVTTRPFSLTCKYLQGSENGRVVTIDNLYEQMRDGRRRTSMEQSEAKIGQIHQKRRGNDGHSRRWHWQIRTIDVSR
jgi:hypothetical protein